MSKHDKSLWAAAAVAVAACGALVVHLSEAEPSAAPAQPKPPSVALAPVAAPVQEPEQVVFQAQEAPNEAQGEAIVPTQPPPEPVEPDDEQTAEARQRTEQAKRFVPQPSPEAAAERDEVVAALAKTGSGGDEWRAQLESIEREWMKLDAATGVGAELSTWACYKGGCSIDVTLPSTEAQESFSRLVTGGSALSQWQGPGFHSGPVRLDSGEVRVTWVFYAPPVDVTSG